MSKVETITTSPSSINIVEGTWCNDLAVQATSEDAGNQNLTWNSDNMEVASVIPELGSVYANAPGTANISATDGSGVQARYSVTVEPRVYISSITLNKSSMVIGKGETWKLCATISPTNASNTTVRWSSEDCSIASVDSNGVVRAKSLGAVKIAAESCDGSGKFAECAVTVRQTTTSASETRPRNKSATYKASVPVDVYSGAHKLHHKLISLFGGQKLSFNINYDSTHLAKGDVGIGWYHNYEKRIEISEDVAYIYSGPSEFAKYTATNGCNTEFVCDSLDKKGYILTVDTLATYPYSLNCHYERTEYYDCSGRLVKIVDRQGFKNLITYSDNGMTITDSTSQKHIHIEKDSCGKIVRVYDDDSREATLSYRNDLLVGIDDVNGCTFRYTYESDGRIERGIDPCGNEYFLNLYDGAGRLVWQRDGSAEGNSTSFSYDGNERIITDRNGKETIKEFNNLGLLIKQTDATGHTTRYEYDSRYNLIKETDGLGNYTLKEYNNFNKPIKITDKNGNVTTLEYDTVGNLKKITYPCIADAYSREIYEYNGKNQMTKHTDLRGTVTTYTYDENGMPATKKVGDKPAIEYTYTDGLLMSEKDANGNITRYEYNELGLVQTVINADNKRTCYVYDNLGNVKSITDANGKTVVNTYDNNGQKISVTDACGNRTQYSYNGVMKNDKITLPDGNTVKYEFDGEERVTKIIDQTGEETLMTYDGAGRLQSKTAPDGAQVCYSYDAAGNIIRERNPNSASVIKTYDNLGNVLTVTDTVGNTTHYEYNEQSMVEKVTNAAGATTKYEYSKAGDLVKETDAQSNKKEYVYDAYGNLVRVKDANGNATEYTYDANNNRLTVKNALGEVTSYTYNCLNQCTAVTDAAGNTVSYEYDVLGRRVAVTDARGNRFTTEYDACGNVLKTLDADNNVITETRYNCLNLPQSATDATGKTLNYSYNKLGKVETVTDSMGNKQTFSYDACGRNNTVKDDLDGESKVTYDRLGNITRLEGPIGGATDYSYDAMGRLLAESTTAGGNVIYRYNELNLRKLVKNARAQTIGFAYDACGRISVITYPETPVNFNYDDNGNVTRVKDSHGNITRTFDALNRVTSYTDTYDNTIHYTYDTVGNLVTITYPDNTEVNYEYNANHNLTKVTDWANRVTTYTYDVNNRVVGVVKPNGTTVTTTYDRNKVKTTVEKTAGGTVITGFEYTYDNLSRIIEEKVLANSTKMCYTYDDLNRVTSRTVKKLSDNSVISTETFTYDAAGNITDALANCFAYDTNNKLVVFNGNTVSYDLDGNMLSNGTLTCTYDPANKLVSAGGHTYTYNAENVRIRNLCADEDTTYTYDTNCKLSKLLCKTTNGVTTKYVYGRGLIGEEVGGTFKTYHFDSRGSTIAITDASGNITDTFAYDTYGKLISRTGTSAVIFGYNGRDGVVTEDNGLIYMRARYYSPEMKRFINADIVAGKLSNAITLNRFAYANGNPVSFVDPFGLSPWNRFKEKAKNALNWGLDKLQDVFDLGAEIIEYVAMDLDDDIGEVLTEFGQNIKNNYIAPIVNGLTLFPKKNTKASDIKIVGQEKRTSYGWESSNGFINTPIFRFGLSHYETEIEGNKGILYKFSGSSRDIMNFFETTYYGGFGIDLFDMLGLEIQLENAGIAAQVSCGDYAVGADVNIAGATSITFSKDYELDSGNIETRGVTVGFNTGLLAFTLLATYYYLITGNSAGFDRVGEVLERTS